ncbi:hypothetical protein D3C84_840540 [compost metagenome]
MATARVPSSFFSDEAMRTKSSPSRTNSVATPRVATLKRSTMASLPLSSCSPPYSAGVLTPLTLTGALLSLRSGCGRLAASCAALLRALFSSTLA